MAAIQERKFAGWEGRFTPAQDATALDWNLQFKDEHYEG
jgi:hypothetical protein